MRRVRIHICTGLAVALLCLCCLSFAPQASSDGTKDWFGGPARLAEEDIERIADRLGERYAFTGWIHKGVKGLKAQETFIKPHLTAMRLLG